jgi:hypothetical protein
LILSTLNLKLTHTKGESMVVVNIVIDETKRNTIDKKVDFHLECNLLKREDWSDLEWSFAKALENMYSVASKLIATNVYKEEHID